MLGYSVMEHIEESNTQIYQENQAQIVHETTRWSARYILY